MTLKKPTDLWQTKWLVAALAGLLLLGGVGTWALRVRSQRQQAAEELANQPLPEQVKVAALGRVEPAGGVVELASPEPGILSELQVEEGDRVAKGQILGLMNTHDVRLAERDFAMSQLIEAEEQLIAQQELGEARVLEADTRVAQVDLPQQQAMRSQEAQIADLEAQLDLARIDLNRFERLASEGAIAQQQLDSQRAQVTQLQQQIAAAQATLAQLATTRDTNLDNATAQVSAAEADLQLAEASAGVLSAERNLQLAEAQLEQTILRAPSTGRVIEIFADPGESVENQAVLSLGNTETMQVVAEVFETDIGLVSVGQPATIRSRNGAFEETLTGQVTDISLQIFKNDILDDDPAANADARVVEVEITVDQPEVIDTLTNLQVDVEIDVEDS